MTWTRLFAGRVGVRRGLAAVLLAGAATLAMAQEAIRLGQTLPLSGPLAELGVEYRDGALAAFRAANAKGGIHGRRIELVTLDDGYVVERTRENARKLLDEHRVLAFFGLFGTANVAAVQPLIDEHDVPSVAPYTGADDLRKFHRNVFWVRASYGDETEKIVEQLVSVGIKRIAVFYQGDAFGESGLGGVERALERRGLKVAAKAPYDKTTLDVAPAVRTIAAADPQAVVLISPYKASAAFIRALKQSGRSPLLFALSVVGVKALTAELGADAAGVAISQVVPFPYSSANPAVRDLQRLPAELQPPSGITYTTLEGFLAGRVMLEALRRAGPQPTREKLVAALESLRDFDAGGFSVSYGPNDHLGSQFTEVTIIGKSGKLMR